MIGLMGDNKMATEQLYLIIKRELKASKRHPGETYWDIDLLGLDDLVVYKTYVSDENKNYRNWADLCVSKNPCHIISFPRGVKLKPGHIINADTKIEIELSRPDWDDAKFTIGKYWAASDPQLEKYGKIELFEQVTHKLGISI